MFASHFKCKHKSINSLWNPQSHTVCVSWPSRAYALCSQEQRERYAHQFSRFGLGSRCLHLCPRSALSFLTSKEGLKGNGIQFPHGFLLLYVALFSLSCKRKPKVAGDRKGVMGSSVPCVAWNATSFLYWSEFSALYVPCWLSRSHNTITWSPTCHGPTRPVPTWHHECDSKMGSKEGWAHALSPDLLCRCTCHADPSL